MIRYVLVAFALCVSSFSVAQSQVKFTFPSASERQIWVAEMPPETLPEQTVKATGGSLEYKTPNSGTRDQVFVWDLATGNLAAKSLSQIAGQWQVQAADFKWIMRVDVRVEHKGKPVESASVRFKDGRRDTTSILDSTRKGVLSFYAVSPNNILVEVTYSTKGKTSEPISQTFKLDLNRKTPIPTLVVSIAEPVATVEEGAASESGGTEEAGGAVAPDSKGNEPKAGAGTTGGGGKGGSDTTNPLGGLLSFLIALLVAAGAFWLLLSWVRKNPATVQKKLEEMGVQVPRSPDQDPASSTPIAPIVQAPPEKIILGDADPLAPVTMVAQSVAVVATGIPRLVGESGFVFEIADGDNLVSREAGDLVIPGESTVSRKHATISSGAGIVRVRDEGSTNGTFVNGIQISAEIELKPGDTVQFGAIRYRFEA
jgi:hypothetical protein